MIETNVDGDLFKCLDINGEDNCIDFFELNDD